MRQSIYNLVGESSKHKKEKKNYKEKEKLLSADSLKKEIEYMFVP